MVSVFSSVIKYRSH